MVTPLPSSVWVSMVLFEATTSSIAWISSKSDFAVPKKLSGYKMFKNKNTQDFKM